MKWTNSNMFVNSSLYFFPKGNAGNKVGVTKILPTLNNKRLGVKSVSDIKSFRLKTNMQGPEDGDTAWTELRPGVHIRTLFEGVDKSYKVALIHYLPNTSVPMHEHIGGEHLFVLQGSQEDENGIYGPGTYVYNPPGTYHDVQSSEGCLVLVHWQAPVRFVNPLDD